MPWASRITSTSASRPASSSVPLVSGSGRRTRATPATSDSTRSSTTPMATYAVIRRAGGQPRNWFHRVSTRPGARGDVVDADGSLMVRVIVPCRIIGSRRGRVPIPSPSRHRPRRTVPTYQYACTECGHAFEQFQSFSDDALTQCPECDGRLRKLFNAVGVVFKGSGFYRNDSRDAGSAAPAATGSGTGEKAASTSEKAAAPAASDSKPAAASSGTKPAQA